MSFNVPSTCAPLRRSEPSVPSVRLFGSCTGTVFKLPSFRAPRSSPLALLRLLSPTILIPPRGVLHIFAMPPQQPPPQILLPVGSKIVFTSSFPETCFDEDWLKSGARLGISSTPLHVLMGRSTSLGGGTTLSALSIHRGRSFHHPKWEPALRPDATD